MGVGDRRLTAVFLGTPDFAVPTLEAMIAGGHHVMEVITQPDRPKGRKQELFPSPVKTAALRHGLPVFQPERIRRPEAIEHLRALAPDIMVVVGYGQIIPKSVIELAPLGIVNVHASLLPELRGAAPIQWSVARGMTVTGVTTMQIDEGLDTGGILLRRELSIDPDETAQELSARLAPAGAELLLETLRGLADGSLRATPQDSSRATLAPILKKEDGRIDWNWSARAIHDRIRGFQPWPGAYTVFRGQKIHIWSSRISSSQWKIGSGAEPPLPGSLLHERGVFAMGGDGTALELLEVQLEGRKRMPAEVFANGHRLTGADRLGA